MRATRPLVCAGSACGAPGRFENQPLKNQPSLYTEFDKHAAMCPCWRRCETFFSDLFSNGVCRGWGSCPKFRTSETRRGAAGSAGLRGIECAGELLGWRIRGGTMHKSCHAVLQTNRNVCHNMHVFVSKLQCIILYTTALEGASGSGPPVNFGPR